MIIVKLISGLGNQLFQYTVARQLALKNHDTVKLDTSFYQNQKLRSYTLDRFNICADLATKTEVANVLDVYTNTSLYNKVYRKVEAHLPKYLKKYYKEDGWWGYEPGLYNIKGDVYLDGYWQHYKYYENINPQIFQELTLKDATETQQLSIFNQVQNDAGSVSLHIRRGDYIIDKNAFDLMGVLPLDYYRRSISYICERVKTPNFYIFSDDLMWARDNLKLTHPATFVEIESGKKDYLELMLMSYCRHNILANSSFSWWGGFLNKNVNKIVTAPRQWVRETDMNEKVFLSFPDWVKL